MFLPTRDNRSAKKRGLPNRCRYIWKKINNRAPHARWLPKAIAALLGAQTKAADTRAKSSRAGLNGFAKAKRRQWIGTAASRLKKGRVDTLDTVEIVVRRQQRQQQQQQQKDGNNSDA